MSAPLAPAARRPVVVTIAVVLVYLSGLASIAIGLLILLSRYRVEASEVLPVSLIGAGVILFGLLTIAVASGVSRGRRFGRLLVTIYLVVQSALRIVTVLTADAWDWSSVVELGAYVFIAIALWAPPGSRFFARSPADHTGVAPAS